MNVVFKIGLAEYQSILALGANPMCTKVTFKSGCYC